MVEAELCCNSLWTRNLPGVVDVLDSLHDIVYDTFTKKAVNHTEVLDDTYDIGDDIGVGDYVMKNYADRFNMPPEQSLFLAKKSGTKMYIVA